MAEVLITLLYKAMVHISCCQIDGVNIMAADDLANQGTRTSASMPGLTFSNGIYWPQHHKGECTHLLLTVHNFWKSID